MPAEIVNLNKVRKAKARVAKEVEAAENRVKFGRSKEERVRQEHETSRRQRELDGVRRDTVPGSPQGSDGDGTKRR